MKCPVCGGDPMADISELKALVRAHGLTSEHADPGGRELRFGDRVLRLSDQCNTCDAKTIREFLEGKKE